MYPDYLMSKRFLKLYFDTVICMPSAEFFPLEENINFTKGHSLKLAVCQFHTYYIFHLVDLYMG